MPDMESPMGLEDKKRTHEVFWRGEGPCLILIPAPEPEWDGSVSYAEAFAEPRLMWEVEVRRARAVLDWPTDGIPTVRPNLGVVFLPAMVGQDYVLPEGQTPWPDQSLDEEAIRAITQIDITQAELMLRAAEFYEIHQASGEREIIAYHPDTQGVFDNAHMLYGTPIFCDIIDDSQSDWIHELLDICLDLYLRASWHIKGLLGEKPGSMIHGHATPQGVHFPHAGVRVSEDTATLFSPKTIEEVIMPYIECSAAPFGGAFAHFCGRHESLFEQLCRSPLIRAIDLQQGMHDLRWLLERCAESGTILYSKVEPQEGEDWPAYVRRLAGIIRDTGARCILRPDVYPAGRDECAAMLELWHELTS